MHAYHASRCLHLRRYIQFPGYGLLCVGLPKSSTSMSPYMSLRGPLVNWTSVFSDPSHLSLPSFSRTLSTYTRAQTHGLHPALVVSILSLPMGVEGMYKNWADPLPWLFHLQSRIHPHHQDSLSKDAYSSPQHNRLGAGLRPSSSLA